MITSPLYQKIQEAPLEVKLRILALFLGIILLLAWVICLGVIVRSKESPVTNLDPQTTLQ